MSESVAEKAPISVGNLVIQPGPDGELRAYPKGEAPLPPGVRDIKELKGEQLKGRGGESVLAPPPPQSLSNQGIDSPKLTDEIIPSQSYFKSERDSDNAYTSHITVGNLVVFFHDLTQPQYEQYMDAQRDAEELMNALSSDEVLALPLNEQEQKANEAAAAQIKVYDLVNNFCVKAWRDPSRNLPPCTKANREDLHNSLKCDISMAIVRRSRLGRAASNYL